MPRFDDPVAGHDDGDGIDVIGLAHRPHCAWRADLLGDASVGADLAPGDVAERIPDAQLKIGAPQIEWDRREVFGCPFEIVAQRLDVDVGNSALIGQGVTQAFEGKAQQPCVAPFEPECPEAVGLEGAPPRDRSLVGLPGGDTFCGGHGSLVLFMLPVGFNCMRTEP